MPLSWVISAARRIVPSPPITTRQLAAAAGVRLAVGELDRPGRTRPRSRPRSAASSPAAGPRSRGSVSALHDARATSRASSRPGVGEQQDATRRTSASIGCVSRVQPSHPATPSRAAAAPRRRFGSASSAAGPRRSHRKNSTLPDGPGQRAAASPPGRPSRAPAAASATVRDRLGPQRGVADHAALADPVLADLELRLDHQRQVAVGSVTPISASSTSVREMNDRSPTTTSTGSADHARGQVADVRAVVHHDPLVLLQRPGQLPVADVDGHHLPAPCAQQHVGEPAGRRAGVQAAAAGHDAARPARTPPARRPACGRRGRRSRAGPGRR